MIGVVKKDESAYPSSGQALTMTQATSGSDEDENENEVEAEGQDKMRSMSIASTIAPMERTPQFLSITADSLKRSPVNPRTPQFLTVSPLFASRLQTAALARTRHSIDVKSLPSYLAKKRQSTFNSKLFETLVEVVSSPFQAESPADDKPIFEEPEAPTLSLGERVAWVKTSGPEFGTIRWIGRMPQITAHWTVGVEFDNAIGNGDGRFEGRRYFVAKENFAKFLPLASIVRVDNYVGRPRSGTMLSRMSVQLKPGQLISVQRTPSVNRISLHCALNAPHHVDHDVHKQNLDHCLCNNCNHPCAHLCHTRKPKGKKEDMAHMCHFSHKPHNKMCCGGEDLMYAVAKRASDEKSSIKASTHETQTTKGELTKSDLDTKEVSRCKPPLGGFTSGGADRKQVEESFFPPLKERTGSDLSISSLPSTSSAVEVYIARGALTDESDLESDVDIRHSGASVCSKRSRGFRSWVSCLVPSITARKKTKEKLYKGERCKKKKKQFKLTNSSCSYRSPGGGGSDHKQRGLSASPEVDDSHCSYCHHTPDRAASASPQPVQNENKDAHDKCTRSPPPPARNGAVSPMKVDETLSERSNQSSVSTAVKPTPASILEEVSAELEAVENESTKSSSKSSGLLVTTTAEIETRSPSAQSEKSDGSSTLSPRRRRKKPAPAPPSPCSLNPSQSSTASIPSPRSVSPSASTSGSSKRERSVKSRPAPTPPPLKSSLKRSMSEQRQLNVKNMLNAAPSCSSEVDLVCASKETTSHTLEGYSIIISYEDYEYDLLRCADQVPKNCKLSVPPKLSEVFRDVSVQVDIDHEQTSAYCPEELNLTEKL